MLCVSFAQSLVFLIAIGCSAYFRNYMAQEHSRVRLETGAQYHLPLTAQCIFTMSSLALPARSGARGFGPSQNACADVFWVPTPEKRPNCQSFGHLLTHTHRLVSAISPVCPPPYGGPQEANVVPILKSSAPCLLRCVRSWDSL